MNKTYTIMLDADLQMFIEELPYDTIITLRDLRRGTPKTYVAMFGLRESHWTTAATNPSKTGCYLIRRAISYQGGGRRILYRLAWFDGTLWTVSHTIMPRAPWFGYTLSTFGNDGVEWAGAPEDLSHLLHSKAA